MTETRIELINTSRGTFPSIESIRGYAACRANSPEDRIKLEQSLIQEAVRQRFAEQGAANVDEETIHLKRAVFPSRRPYQSFYDQNRELGLT